MVTIVSTARPLYGHADTPRSAFPWVYSASKVIFTSLQEQEPQLQNTGNGHASFAAEAKVAEGQRKHEGACAPTGGRRETGMLKSGGF